MLIKHTRGRSFNGKVFGGVGGAGVIYCIFFFYCFQKITSPHPYNLKMQFYHENVAKICSLNRYFGDHGTEEEESCYLSWLGANQDIA